MHCRYVCGWVKGVGPRLCGAHTLRLVAKQYIVLPICREHAVFSRPLEYW